MCVIVDANALSAVFAEPTQDDFQALVDWLFKGAGALVYGGRLLNELERVSQARRAVAALNRAGRATQVPAPDVDSEERRLSSKALKSNDGHVIALARVSGARTLCSGDIALQADFRNPGLIGQPRGHVYWPAGSPKRRPQHARLLRHTTSCPRAFETPRRRTTRPGR